MPLEVLNKKVCSCRRCPRLVEWRERTAREKVRRHRDEEYWGKPVPGFGDPRAQLMILGLAPGAHGSNRTGRMFTGDRSGEFLYPALYRAGFASQPEARDLDDGLKLRNCYITAAVRCAPPQNKPTKEEQANCHPFLEEEFRLLPRLRAVLALGKLAHDTYLRLLKGEGRIESLAAYRFAHGAKYDVPLYGSRRSVRLFDTFHPSQQNTQTGKLTAAMFDRVLGSVQQYLRGLPAAEG